MGAQKKITHEIVTYIVNRLNENKADLKRQFNEPHGIPTRHFLIDNLLPDNIAHEIYRGFPGVNKMRLMKSFREVKFTTKNMEFATPLLQECLFAFQDPQVIKVIEEITGFKEQHPDPQLYAGGLSLMQQGHFLNPHIDNSHDGQRKYYRTLNLLYYATPGWQIESGGHLELWDKKVKHAKVLHSLFNRLVVMETNRHSWHSVSPVTDPARPRTCVSNYYFSPLSPDGHEYFHITSFSARPEQPLRRMVASLDNVLRSSVRKIRPAGLGKTDVYRPKT